MGELLTFDDPDLPPELRAQRVLRRSRVPQIAEYLVANPDDYVLSAMTASVDADVEFVDGGPLAFGARVGELVLPGDARILVNDGQHRRAAIATALEVRPELGDESIPLVLFLDVGLARSQQIFADLNRHAVRPTPSLNVLYDHRDEVAGFARRVAGEVCPFAGFTELEKSSLSNRTSAMFTLSAIHQATLAFSRPRRHQPWDLEQEERALEFWKAVGALIQSWGFLTDGRTAADLRRDYLHAHGVALHALGVVGGQLLATDPEDWLARLARLREVDWSRSNPLWDGRAIQNGRISKSNPSLILTTNVLRARVGLALSETERALENGLPEGQRVAA